MAVASVQAIIVGFGNVAAEFTRICQEKEADWREEYGIQVHILAVVTRSKGTLWAEEGLPMHQLLRAYEANGRFPEDSKHATNATVFEILSKSSANLVIELTSLNIETGRPAIDYVRAAIDQGKHVITANKGPIAHQYKQLRDLAKLRGVHFLFEGVVMDGVPVFNLVRETMRNCKILGFRGVLNSTTNFILTEMEEKGTSLPDCIKEAQRLNFAEADPSMDIEGWDAAAKTAALMNVIMDSNSTPQDVKREGIGGVTQEKLLEVKKRGRSLKLLCVGRRDNDGAPVGSVELVELEPHDPLAILRGTSSALTITTDMLGDVTITSVNPQLRQTAYAIASDLLSLVHLHIFPPAEMGRKSSFSMTSLRDLCEGL